MKNKAVLIILALAVIAVFIAARSLQKPSESKRAPDLTKKSEEGILKGPETPEKYDKLGLFYLNHNKLGEAENAFKRALGLSPKYGPSLENLGFTYYKKSDYENALIYLNNALEVIPDTPSLHNTLGAVYRAKKMYPMAIKEHKKAIELNPKYYEAYYNLALAYQDMKSPEEKNAWRKYIEVASKTPSEKPYVEFAREALLRRN